MSFPYPKKGQATKNTPALGRFFWALIGAMRRGFIQEEIFIRGAYGNIAKL